MARYTHLSRKLRLAKLGRRTRWAPFWTVLKAFGKGKRVHPSRLTDVKRHWKRSSTKA